MWILQIESAPNVVYMAFLPANSKFKPLEQMLYNHNQNLSHLSKCYTITNEVSTSHPPPSTPRLPKRNLPKKTAPNWTLPLSSYPSQLLLVLV